MLERYINIFDEVVFCIIIDNVNDINAIKNISGKISSHFDDDEFFIKTAFEFIDPVKAIYERAMGRNPILIKAFVQSIINNDCDKRLKGDKYKSKIPKHINCFSCINILDVYGYDELVDVLTKQINTILNVEK
jgi:hypothetical protein